MDRIKRLKLSNPNYIEIQNHPELEHSTVSLENEKSNAENNPKLYLSILPQEILLYIYQYLSPLDLLSLSHLDQRFDESSSYILLADFSSSCRASPQQVTSFFSRLRVKYIQKLNFNYNIFVKPSILTQLICRCKNITALSVVECGIECKHLNKILQSCTNLEQLSWSINKDDELTLNTCSNKMKTVYLFFVSNRMRYSLLLKFIKNFPNLEYFYLSLAADKLAVFPFHGVWRKTYCESLSSEKFVVITNSSAPAFILDTNKIIFDLSSLYEEKHDNSTENGCKEKLAPNSCPPYLQIQTEEKDISLLSSKTYSSLALLVTYEVENLSEKIVQNIEKVASNKLKHLSIGPKFSYQMSDYHSFAVCEIIKGIAHSCQNITVLNLSFHFVNGSPFEAISQLGNLKTLVVAACVFKPAHKKDKLTCDFGEMVKKCPKVENFTLIRCTGILSFVSDSDMYPVFQWKRLKHLTICNVLFQSSNFLMHVATNCKEFKSLSLITDSPFYAFNNNIIYLLKVAKNLSFIRINAANFNPMYERFWDSIGGAANLEGICIITQHSAALVKQTIIQAIQKLKYLHLFHFCHPCASDNLYNEVRKSMREHGVSNVKIERECASYRIPALLAHERNTKHEQPHFCCKRLHLEPLDILPF